MSLKMVNIILRNNKEYFVCPLCDMVFKKRKQAEHCEVRCKEGKECQGKMVRHCVRF
jgi:uncharacterized C2H2 Zn-finger protein